jgi:hypothetical protein
LVHSPSGKLRATGLDDTIELVWWAAAALAAVFALSAAIVIRAVNGVWR